MKLQNTIFLALCCTLGLFAKKLIGPFSNVITDALHIPGGVSTAFSLMFLVVAAGITEQKWSATLMGAVQSVLALAFGMVGSMGILAPVGYVLPGIAIDLLVTLPRDRKEDRTIRLFLANVLASMIAALIADLLVFHLPGLALAVYLGVAATSGGICGYLAGVLCGRLRATNLFQGNKEMEE